MRTITAALSVGLLCAAVAACSGTADVVSGTAQKTKSASVPTPAQADEPSADDPQTAAGLTYSAPPDRPMALGEAWQWTSTTRSGAKATGTTAVLAYEQHKPPSPADENLRYDQVKVRICSTAGTPITVYRRFIALIRPTGEVNTIKMKAPDPKTAFPSNDIVLKPGQCAEGTIDFLGARSARPALAVWGPNGAPKAAKWAIPQ
ncbi:hypothetical protein EJ357_17760 [Streptomyces cyaneochromogenes]|uniref:Lipoprotein n=1 Tax=Streptomyces cyaneochromogenes TaxID=2496836 RepID=A0A3S9M7F1_9ACTN|nr:hypothetical protein [Streptomyces cyaneochromogenes]AZQ35114.1 hypothetical protein EJ357_17760 [Streptomyces cyaneochromogenes]